jgi:hypothetical protein
MEYSLYFEDSQRCCRGWIGVEATELFRVGPLAGICFGGAIARTGFVGRAGRRVPKCGAQKITRAVCVRDAGKYMCRV